MKLKSLLSNVTIKQQFGTSDKELSKVVFDSRKVELHSLFVAVRGTQVDGHQYIEQAIENGASTIICETFPKNIKATITYIKVTNSF